jgi:hypothetical protein
MSKQSSAPKERVQSTTPNPSAPATPPAATSAASKINDDSRADLWGSCAVFVLVQYLYSITVYPFVSGGDSGELMQAICSGDVM